MRHQEHSDAPLVLAARPRREAGYASGLEARHSGHRVYDIRMIFQVGGH